MFLAILPLARCSRSLRRNVKTVMFIAVLVGAEVRQFPSEVSFIHGFGLEPRGSASRGDEEFENLECFSLFHAHGKPVANSWDANSEYLDKLTGEVVRQLFDRTLEALAVQHKGLQSVKSSTNPYAFCAAKPRHVPSRVTAINHNRHSFVHGVHVQPGSIEKDFLQKSAATSDDSRGDAVGSTDPKGTRAVAALSIGAVAGGLGGSLGLGGGFLVVPALTSLLGVEPRVAIGTSATVVLAVSCAACRAYLLRGLASTRAAATIALAAVLSARLGAGLTKKAKAKALKRGFGGYLLIVSSLIALKAFGILKAAVSIPSAGASVALLPLIFLGAITGFISGLLGVGGGTVLVPALTLGLHFPQAEAQGCALLGMIPPSLISASTHWSNKNVDRQLVGAAVLGALLGGVGGSAVASRLPETALRIVFSAVLASVAVKYLRS